MRRSCTFMLPIHFRMLKLRRGTICNIWFRLMINIVIFFTEVSKETHTYYYMEEVHFWPSNYWQSLLLIITSKRGIFDHQTLKTVHFLPSDGFAGRFCWHGCHVVGGHMSASSLTSSSILSLFSLLSPPTDYQQPSPRLRLPLCRCFRQANLPRGYLR
jgi:hypothetical protein